MPNGWRSAPGRGPLRPRHGDELLVVGRPSNPGSRVANAMETTSQRTEGSPMSMAAGRDSEEQISIRKLSGSLDRVRP